jgi:hypothetical protein
MLRQCILNAKNQSYTDFTHTIGIMYDNESEVADYGCLYDDILDDRFIIGYHKNLSHHERHLITLSQCPGPYDIYIKTDDDDIYKRDYVKTVVEYFSTHECDVLSSHIVYQLNNYFLSKGNYRSLGGDYPNNNYLMPMTFAFNHKAYQILLNVKDNNNNDDPATIITTKTTETHTNASFSVCILVFFCIIWLSENFGHRINLPFKVY